jgi:CubicO group peptidase (beta-lactamase class C family)
MAVRPGPVAFGHFGAGGSLGFCDPGTGIAVGYVINQIGPGLAGKTPHPGLIDAAYACS